jgi:hypothetical protein
LVAAECDVHAAAAVGIMWLLDGRGMPQCITAGALFIGAGAFVEFWWFGVAGCVAAWAYCRRPTAGRALGWVLATASLGVVNGNLWALAAVPIVFRRDKKTSRSNRAGTSSATCHRHE